MPKPVGAPDGTAVGKNEGAASVGYGASVELGVSAFASVRLLEVGTAVKRMFQLIGWAVGMRTGDTVPTSFSGGLTLILLLLLLPVLLVVLTTLRGDEADGAGDGRPPSTPRIVATAVGAMVGNSVIVAWSGDDDDVHGLVVPAVIAGDKVQISPLIPPQTPAAGASVVAVVAALRDEEADGAGDEKLSPPPQIVATAVGTIVGTSVVVTWSGDDDDDVHGLVEVAVIAGDMVQISPLIPPQIPAAGASVETSASDVNPRAALVDQLDEEGNPEATSDKLDGNSVMVLVVEGPAGIEAGFDDDGKEPHGLGGCAVNVGETVQRSLLLPPQMPAVGVAADTTSTCREAGDWLAVFKAVAGAGELSDNLFGALAVDAAVSHSLNFNPRMGGDCVNTAVANTAAVSSDF